MLEHVQIEAARAEIIFAVYFEPAYAWPLVEELAVVRGAQADARKGAHGVGLGHGFK